MNSPKILAIITTGLLLSILGAISILSASTPTIWAPSPLPLIIIHLFLRESPLTFFVIPLLFWIWNMQLFQGKGIIPTRSVLALVICTGFSIAFFFTGWSGGLEFQGLPYTLSMSILNGALIVALYYLLFTCKKHPSFVRNLLFHGLATFWFFSYAFPFFGELP